MQKMWERLKIAIHFGAWIGDGLDSLDCIDHTKLEGEKDASTCSDGLTEIQADCC